MKCIERNFLGNLIKQSKNKEKNKFVSSSNEMKGNEKGVHFAREKGDPRVAPAEAVGPTRQLHMVSRESNRI